MKLIDLYVKIAKGEEPPKKIKVYDEIYEYDSFNKYYWNSNNKQLFEVYNGKILNYCVEIIEDTQKEDKKLPRVSLLDVKTDYKLKDILNEIINKVNGE